MAYRQLDYNSPNYIEHEFYYAGNYGAKGEKRAEKEKITPLQVAKQNQWNRIKRLRTRIVFSDRKRRNGVFSSTSDDRSGTISMLSLRSFDSCVSTSKVRMVSMSFPKKSMR